MKVKIATCNAQRKRSGWAEELEIREWLEQVVHKPLIKERTLSCIPLKETVVQPEG